MSRFLSWTFAVVIGALVFALPLHVHAQVTPAEVAALKKQLRDADVKVRISALDALLKANPNPRHIADLAEPLFALHKDADPEVRSRVMITLPWFMNEKAQTADALKILREHFKDADDSTRINAIRSAIFQAPETAAEAVPVLIDVMRTKPAFRAAALSLIAQTGKHGKAATPEIFDALKTEGGLEFDLALEAIDRLQLDIKPALPILAKRAHGKISGYEGEKLARVFAKHDMPELTLAIRPLLMSPGHGTMTQLTHCTIYHDQPERVLKALIPLLKDADPKTRTLAAFMLANIERQMRSNFPAEVDAIIEKLGGSSKEMVENLRANLKDKDLSVRWYSAVALARAKSPAAKEAVPLAIGWLSETWPPAHVVDFVHEAHLARIVFAADPEKAASLVFDAVKISGDVVKDRLAIAVHGLPTETLKAHLVKSLAADQAHKLYAFRVFRAMYDQTPKVRTALMPLLAKVLDDPEVAIRLNAAEVLLNVGTKEYGPVVAVAVKALDEKEPALRLRAIHVLYGMGPNAGAARTALIKTLDDADPLVQLRAAAALFSIDPAKIEPIMPVLKKNLDKHDNASMPETLMLVKRLGPAAGPLVPSLVALIEDKQSPHRLSAAQTLLRVDPKRTEPALQAIVDTMANPKWNRAEEDRVMQMLRQLGPIARPALPALHQSLEQTKSSRNIRWSAMLAMIDPTDKNSSMLFLRTCLSGKGNGKSGVKDQLSALREIEDLGPQAKVFVPELASLLKTEKNVKVLVETAYVLESMGRAAKDALPALEALAKSSEDSAVQSAVREAISSIKAK
jgi:HEAT repeat protein